MELDTRGSHFYLAMYWAEALANQEKNTALKSTFSKVAEEMKALETQIVNELKDAQGKPQDIGGYYLPDAQLVAEAMRPSKSLNAILEKI